MPDPNSSRSQVIIDFIARTDAVRGGINFLVGRLGVVQRTLETTRRVAFGAGVGIGGALVGAGYQAATFERNMRNVNTIVRESEVGYARLSDEIIKLSTELPKSANDLAQGAYAVASAGFTDAASVTDILTESAKASSAGLTDTLTAANAVVTVMNAYGAAAGSAAHVSDLLFKTVEVGQVTFEQLAINIGDFIGVSNAVGASLEDTFALFANITIATGNAARAATSVQGVFRMMIKPSEDMTRVMKSLGFASGKTMVQTLGVQGALQKLYDAVGRDETALAKLFQDVEGLNGVLAVLGPNSARAAENQEKFRDPLEVNGSAAAALTEQMKSFTAQLDQLKNSVGALMIEFGRYLLPGMKLATMALSLLVDILHGIPEPIKMIMTVGAGFTAFMLTAGFAVLGLVKTLQGLRKILHLLQGTSMGGWLMSVVTKANIAAVTMKLFGRQIEITSAKMKTMAGAALGVIGALSLVPSIGKWLDQALIPQNVDDMTKALVDLRDNTGEIADNRAFKKFGTDFDKLAGKIKKFAGASWGKQFKEDWKVWESPLGSRKKAISDVDELDKALAQLVETGNVKDAEELYARIQGILSAEGIDSKQMKQAFNDYEKAIGGVALANRAANKSETESEEAIRGKLEAVQKAQEATDGYKDKMKELAEATSTFIGLTKILTDIENERKDAYDKALEPPAEDKRIQRMLDEQQLTKDLGEATKEVNRIRRITNNAPIVGSDIWYDLLEAEQKVKQTELDLADLRRGEQDEYKKTPATIQEIINKLDAQIQKYHEFEASLRTLATRGMPTEVIRELQGMGEEGAELAKVLATAPASEFERLKGLLVDKVRIQSAEYQTAMDLQLMTAAASVKTNAQSTVNDVLNIIKQIAPGITAEIPNVVAAMKQMGLAINFGEQDKVALGGTTPPEIIPSPTMSTADRAVLAAGGGTGAGPMQLPNQVPLMPGETDPWGRKVVSKDDRFPWDPKQYVRSTIADQGATIYPGTTIVQNKTPLPEYILTASQMNRLIPARAKAEYEGRSRTLQEHRTTYSFGNIYAQDLQAAIAQAQAKARLAALAGGPT